MERAKNIEILTVPGCSAATSTRADIDALLKKYGLQNVKVREIVIQTPEQAIQEKFPGSPTVRVDGVDVESSPGEIADYGMG